MSGGSKRVTIGHWLLAYVHLIVCKGPVDKLHQLIIGERTMWAGSVTSNGTIGVSALNLFGGEKLDGGVAGNIDVEFGAETQARNATLQSFLGAQTPAYRGFFGLVFKDFYWSFTNPQFKPVWVRVERIQADWDGGTPWYPEKITIARNYNDMNPVHALYQISTAQDWNIRWPVARIDDASWRAAADTIYTEQIGISGVLKGEIGKDQQDVLLKIIGGYLKENKQTGKIELHLMRANYDIDDLLELNQSNSDLLSFNQMLNVGGLANSYVLKYTNDDGASVSITENNLAAVDQAEGEIPVTDTIELIKSPRVARIIARRELRQISSPLAKMSRACNAAVWNKSVNDYVKVNDPLVGQINVVYRITNIAPNDNGGFNLDLVQDVFGLSSAIYDINEETGNNYDPTPVNPAADIELLETPYWFVHLSLDPAERDYLPPDYGYVMSLVKRNTSGPFTYQYELNQSLDNVNYTEVDFASYTPTAVADGIITKYADVVEYTNSLDITIDLIDATNTGTTQVLLYAVSSTTEELMAVESINISTQSISVRRAVLDTVPQQHPSGTKLFLLKQSFGADETQYLIGDLLYYKVLPFTAGNVLALEDATTEQIIIQSRASRPYAPGQFKVAGLYEPAITAGPITISWAHRNRLTQTVSLVDYDEGGVTPEAGTTYTLKIYNASNTLVRTVTGITADNYVYSTADRLADGNSATHRFTLVAVRDGLESWQMHDLTVNTTQL